ncbi:Chromosome partition protein Smc [subsurface metagenome]
MVVNNIYDRLSGEFFIKPEEVPVVNPEAEFDSEKEKLILEDMRRKFHTIGDVNLSAKTDYNEEKKRLDFLQSERDDLISAGDKLKVTIEKINQIAKARFTETFEKIRANFKELFSEFFDGGVCDLELNESQDLLEADIRITARPPGKNVRAINLLSSGERALTAISMLFAIYQVKPSPFCILDEVDAPLDDANLDRFLKVIKDFSKRIQFIIVTHNKKTMSEADNLYGITMNEPGLSSLISVRLSEVDISDSESGVVGNGKNEVKTAEKSE